MPEEKKGPPMETIQPAVGPNETGLADQARAAQWRKEDAGDEPAPAAAKSTKRTRTRGSR